MKRIHFQTIIIAILLCCSNSSLAGAAEWYVHADRGDDQHLGTQAQPLATLQLAVNRAEPGDVIHLGPANGILRQSCLLNRKRDLTIEGHGVTLEGADPLPAEGWEQLAEDLFRRQLPRTAMDRHLLIIDGRMERMGRTQSSNSPEFPAVDQLQPGQFCFENLDDKTGWLYVRGSVERLEWAVRVNGFATGGENENITVRNLNARNLLNDGFNLHGAAVGMKFFHIQGYDCFDEGFSAHETCECEIHDGEFWGNENGIADVNDCQTIYRRCLFRDNVNTDVLLIGKTHALIDCRIENRTDAAALVAGPRGPEKKLFQLQLDQLTVNGRSAAQPARVRINGGQLTIRNCDFQNTDLNTTGAFLVEPPSP